MTNRQALQTAFEALGVDFRAQWTEETAGGRVTRTGQDIKARDPNRRLAITLMLDNIQMTADPLAIAPKGAELAQRLAALPARAGGEGPAAYMEIENARRVAIDAIREEIREM